MELVQDESSTPAEQNDPVAVPRTLAQVKEFYKELCNAAGQLQYQIKVHQQELDAVMMKMSETNIEASKLHAQEVMNG